MGIKVRWLIEDRIILSHIYGIFTLQEMASGQAEAAFYIQLSAKKSFVVHHILDMLDMHEYPRMLSKIVQGTPMFNEPNLGWVVVITEDPLVVFLANSVLKLARKPLHVCKTQTDALAFLRSVDESLASH